MTPITPLHSPWDPYPSPRLMWVRNALTSLRKGGCTALDKATCIHQVADILTSTTPQLSEAEVNDALGSYLEIIEQHLRTLDSGRSIGLNQPGAADEPSTGDKRGTTPECEV